MRTRRPASGAGPADDGPWSPSPSLPSRPRSPPRARRAAGRLRAAKGCVGPVFAPSWRFPETQHEPPGSGRAGPGSRPWMTTCTDPHRPSAHPPPLSARPAASLWTPAAATCPYSRALRGAPLPLSLAAVRGGTVSARGHAHLEPVNVTFSGRSAEEATQVTTDPRSNDRGLPGGGKFADRSTDTLWAVTTRMRAVVGAVCPRAVHSGSGASTSRAH